MDRSLLTGACKATHLACWFTLPVTREGPSASREARTPQATPGPGLGGPVWSRVGQAWALPSSPCGPGLHRRAPGRLTKGPCSTGPASITRLLGLPGCPAVVPIQLPRPTASPSFIYINNFNTCPPSCFPAPCTLQPLMDTGATWSITQFLPCHGPATFHQAEH